MKTTLFSLFIGALIWFLPLNGNIVEGLGIAFILIPLFLLTTLIFAWGLAWGPLQKGEQNITPRLLDMFGRDKNLKISVLVLSCFPAVSLALWTLIEHSPDVSPKMLFILWIVLLGVAIDQLIYCVKKTTRYLNPFKATEIISKNAKEEIRQNRLDMFVDSIDALSEVALRSLERSNTSLAQQAIGELKEVGSTFLSSSKSFPNLNQDVATLEQTHVDKVSFTLFTLLSRFEMIGIKAAERHYEPVVSQVLTSLGRIAISSAHYDLSLVTYPLLSIGKTAIMAVKKGLTESGVKGEIVLSQVARAIINQVELTYVEIKSPFLTLIDNLDQISKERFKQNKDISVQILLQPFLELQSLFKEPKVSGHQDTPVILTELDRVIAEFNALQAVMATIPRMEPISEESLDSSQE